MNSIARKVYFGHALVIHYCVPSQNEPFFFFLLFRVDWNNSCWKKIFTIKETNWKPIKQKEKFKKHPLGFYCKYINTNKKELELWNIHTIPHSHPSVQHTWYAILQIYLTLFKKRKFCYPVIEIRKWILPRTFQLPLIQNFYNCSFWSTIFNEIYILHTNK